MSHSKAVAYCSVTTLVALYVVGAVSAGALRHEVQTLPLWFPIVFGFRQREIAKWMAIPCLVIWLLLMACIWLFLLGWAQLIHGHFTPIEIILTLIVGAASVAGIGIGFRWRTVVGWGNGLGVAALMGVFQIAALRVSFIPYIATH